MGTVYRATDMRLKMPVAIKEMVPQPGLDQHTLSQLRRQFEQEATVLAQLDHPHLVRVTDFLCAPFRTLYTSKMMLTIFINLSISLS